ncbi:GTPase [Reticulomyxa filosa]|uniref:GTPase n=1 Tax=Reticulomyxa filosa TaxID=46433 RepID=X6MQX4_RETFI|nr:GTPase [Reticulomyxa filosa]|eukprot:ETO15495.1 GTPase [Reticulomyxa filosa]
MFNFFVSLKNENTFTTEKYFFIFNFPIKIINNPTQKNDVKLFVCVVFLVLHWKHNTLMRMRYHSLTRSYFSGMLFPLVHRLFIPKVKQVMSTSDLGLNFFLSSTQTRFHSFHTFISTRLNLQEELNNGFFVSPFLFFLIYFNLETLTPLYRKKRYLPSWQPKDETTANGLQRSEEPQRLSTPNTSKDDQILVKCNTSGKKNFGIEGRFQSNLNELKDINDRFNHILGYEFGNRQQPNEKLTQQLMDDRTKHQKDITQLRKAFQEKEKKHLDKISDLKFEVDSLKQKKKFFVVDWVTCFENFVGTKEKEEAAKDNEELKHQCDQWREKHACLAQKCNDLQRDLDEVRLLQTIYFTYLLSSQFDLKQEVLENKLKVLQNERDTLLRLECSQDDEGKMAYVKQNFFQEIGKIRKNTIEYYENLRREYVKNLEESYKSEVNKMRKEKDGLLKQLENARDELKTMAKSYTELGEERLQYLKEMERAKKEKDIAVACLHSRMQEKDKEIENVRHQMDEIQNAYNRLWLNYDHTAGQNVALNQEIEKLKELCERIEQQYNIENPMGFRSGIQRIYEQRGADESSYSGDSVTDHDNCCPGETLGEVALETFSHNKNEMFPLIVKSCQFHGDWKDTSAKSLFSTLVNNLALFVSLDWIPKCDACYTLNKTGSIIRIGFGKKLNDCDIILKPEIYSDLKKALKFGYVTNLIMQQMCNLLEIKVLFFLFFFSLLIFCGCLFFHRSCLHHAAILFSVTFFRIKKLIKYNLEIFTLKVLLHESFLCIRTTKSKINRVLEKEMLGLTKDLLHRFNSNPM